MNVIYLLRKEKGITQEELADVLGVSRQMISNYENEIIMPPVQRLIELSEYFNVSADYLIKGLYDVEETDVNETTSKIIQIVNNTNNDFSNEFNVDCVYRNSDKITKILNIEDTTQKILFDACFLYIILDPTRTVNQKNITTVYELISDNNFTKLNAIFNRLPYKHPAKRPWILLKEKDSELILDAVNGLYLKLRYCENND